MLSSSEKTQIRQLLQTPQWRTAEKIAEAYCAKLSKDSLLRDTEWETLKEALVREGQIQGIRKFVQELYTQATE